MHDCIDARMCFKHGAHAGHSVYQLVDELWRGVRLPTEIVNEAVLHQGLYYNLCNRRTVALHMFQALRRDKLFFTKAVVHDDSHPKFRPERAFRTENMGLGKAPNPKWMGEDVAEHDGCPMWSNAKTATMKLKAT